MRQIIWLSANHWTASVNIFMTTATGYVGSAVASALVARGHHLTALARSSASAALAQSLGAEPVLGHLAGPETYLHAAQTADAIIHAAFEYLPDGRENRECDTQATRFLLSVLGSRRTQRLIYTSNAYLPGVADEQRVGPEAANAPTFTDRVWRLGVENQVLDTAKGGGSAAVLRLGMVYGGSSGGTVTGLFSTARRLGKLPYPEASAGNRQSLIYRGDLAALYATLVESDATGVFHAVDGHPITVLELTRAVAAVAGVATSSQNESDARRSLDAHTVDVMHRDLALHAPRSMALGWRPEFSALCTGLSTAYGEWQAGHRA